MEMEMEEEMDEFSQLPDHLIDRILGFLPIKDAAKTSVLSSRWRYKWAHLPSLAFDDQCVIAPHSKVNEKLVTMIDKVLVLHGGPIREFKLTHRGFTGNSDIDRWILHLSRRGSLTTLVLNIPRRGQIYKVHSSLFSCQDLVHLRLFNCCINPPSGFRGFKQLKGLQLSHVDMTQGAAENLISHSTLLQVLSLVNPKHISHLKIEAPQLLVLDVQGSIVKGISFGNTKSLVYVSLSIYPDLPKPGDCFKHMPELFHHISLVKTLKLRDYSPKLLDIKLASRMHFINLKALSIFLNFKDVDEFLLVLYLLRSSPNLRKVEISARKMDQNSVGVVGNFPEDEFLCWMFEKLRFVSITGITGTKLEMRFIEILLGNAPALEKMTIKRTSSGARANTELLKELLEFRRASALARIVYHRST